ncbi:MAG TPA: SH3 domain-containing protein [bacterium]
MKTLWFPLAAALLAASLVLPAAAPAAEGYAPAPEARGGAAQPEQYVIVTAPEADILAAPKDDAEKIGRVARRTVLPMKGRQAGWYEVATGESQTGWIRSDAVAQIYFPQFLNPEGLPDAWANSQPQYVPPGAYRYPGDWWGPYGYSWGGPWYGDPFWGGPYSYWPGPFWWGGGFGLRFDRRFDRRWDRDHDDFDRRGGGFRRPPRGRDWR